MSESPFQLIAITDGPVVDLPEADALGPVECFAAGPFQAVCRRPPAGEYDGPDAESNLADPEWVTRRALAHQQAVEAAHRQTTACPLPLGVLFSNQQSLDEFLDRNADRLWEFLNTAAGREEYGIKFLAVSPSAEGDAGEAATGADRLRQKLAARKATSDRVARRGEFVEGCIAALEGLGLEARGRQVSTAARDDGSAAIAGLAVLASPDEAERLYEWVRSVGSDAAEAAVGLEVTGPWPAYGFCPELS